MGFLKKVASKAVDKAVDTVFGKPDEGVQAQRDLRRETQKKDKK